jgi:hypothetical protein
MFVLDRSGSMRPLMRHALRAVNDNVAAIAASAGQDQDVTVSFMSFSDVPTLHFAHTTLANFQPLTDLQADGSTALFDATGAAIQTLLALPVGTDEDVSFLVNVVTDGEENASTKFQAPALKALMRQVQATDRWTLTFLLPEGHAGGFVASFGIPDGNVMEWAQTASGVSAYAAASNAALKAYFVQRAQGAGSAAAFYADASKLRADHVRAQLQDITANVDVVHVAQDAPIKKAVEAAGLVFAKGTAFYELVAHKKVADKVQGYKHILVASKLDGKIYAGAEARQMLGLPAHATDVRPGTNGDFDLFVQSTSVNRKVQAGTRVICLRP